MKHMIEWIISGRTEVEAEDHAEAARIFQQIGKRELADEGELEADEPYSEIDIWEAQIKDSMAHMRRTLEETPKGAC